MQTDERSRPRYYFSRPFRCAALHQSCNVKKCEGMLDGGLHVEAHQMVEDGLVRLGGVDVESVLCQ